MAINYWLMKSDPDEYSIEDLKNAPHQTDHWDGVRNYQARNFMRDDMKKGDVVLFYHSQKNPSVVGTATIETKGYPDHTAWEPHSKHYAPKSTPENPIWYMVDVRLKSIFERPVPLTQLRTIPELKDMKLLQKGNRLSVMPITVDEYDIIVSLAKEEK